MNLSELNQLDLNNAASWPMPIKVAAAIIVAAAVIVGGWYLDWSDQTSALERARKEETTLREAFESKQRRAVNLAAYEQQLEEMHASFGAMLRQLPSKAEVSKLLVDISQSGLKSGLEFTLFKPESEIKREFYAELPVKIQVVGSYQQFGSFVSEVANLPRIVTLHDVDIKPTAAKSHDQLTMNITAKTYWYLEEGGARK